MMFENEYALKIYNDSLMARKSELKEEISERAKAEKRLMESEEKYRSLVESTDDSIYVVDRECNYIFMNEKHQGLRSSSYRAGIGSSSGFSAGKSAGTGVYGRSGQGAISGGGRGRLRAG